MIRSCVAADLIGSLGGTNGGGGTSMLAVVVANLSDSACGLKGRPGVRIFAGTKLSPASYADPEPLPGHLVLLTPGTGAPNPDRAISGQAWTWITWSRSCVSAWSGASRLVLELPGGGGPLRIALPAPATDAASPVPAANCPTDAPYLPWVGAWEFRPRAEIATVTPVSLAVLGAVANAPPIAVAGETFTFQVTLTNGTAEPVRFSECPNFTMWISAGIDGKAVTERHQLNCAQAPDLPAHASRTFEMQITVPADWPVTRTGAFGWSLERYAGAAAKLPLVIARRA